MCFFNILFFKCEVQEKIFYFSGSKMPEAWIPWKSENALWHECNLPLTFSVQCSLICLLPMYFQPHWKCLKVPLGNTREPKRAELLEDDQNGLQKNHAPECSKRLERDCFLPELACNFKFDDGFPAWIYVYILRIHFWQVSTSEYYRTCKFRHENYFGRWYFDWYFLELSYCRRAKGRRIMMKQKSSYRFCVGSYEQEMLT